VLLQDQGNDLIPSYIVVDVDTDLLDNSQTVSITLFVELLKLPACKIACQNW